MNVGETVDYGMLVGQVKCDNTKLNSMYDKNAFGPIRKLEIKEHGTAWRSNYSTDTTRMIVNDLNNVPFSIVKNGESGARQIIKIEQPLNAEYLLEALDTTYSHFEPTKQSTFSKILTELTMSESVRGIETTERVLREGTQLTAFGQIEKIKLEPSLFSWLTRQNKYNLSRLSEATNKDKAFILTSLSRTELIDRLSGVTKGLKICLIIFGSIGVAVGAYCAYKFLKDYLAKRRQERMLARARAERLKMKKNAAQRRTTGSNAANDDQSTCVVCLTNPRELVLLDCGHVCLCMDCLEKMTSRQCPICRQNYRTYVSCYIP